MLLDSDDFGSLRDEANRRISQAALLVSSFLGGSMVAVEDALDA